MLNSIPLTYMFILMPAPHCNYYCTFVVSFEIGKSFNLVLLFQNILLFRGLCFSVLILGAPEGERAVKPVISLPSEKWVLKIGFLKVQNWYAKEPNRVLEYMRLAQVTGSYYFFMVDADELNC